MIDSKDLLQYSQNLSLLLVEDDNELRDDMFDILKNFFKEIALAKDGEEAFFLYNEKIQNENCYFDIVLTDIQMPRLDGVGLTKKIYELHDKQFVIVLSAHDESEYLLPLINLGIEQFIKKPIDFQELIEGLLKSTKTLTKSELAQDKSLILLHDNASYDTKTKTLNYKNENIYLTKYEILFMDLISSNEGKIYSNEDIVEYYLCAGEGMDAQNIRKLVSKLRKKLPANTLESVYAIGYRLIPRG